MIYFVSDLHLGLPDFSNSLKREKKIVRWLNQIKNNATDIYFVGDIFEFWYEWKFVIPKYFTRFFGKLAQLSDMNINLHFFSGNHDIWAFGYFEKEFKMKIYKKPLELIVNEKKFFVAHGDGLGPGDKFYKILKKFFTNKILQWLFSNILHPDLAFRIAKIISYKRDACNKKPVFKADQEWLIKYAKKIEKNKHFNYYVFGHRHIPIKYKLKTNATVIMLGDWIKNFTYAQFDGKNLELKKFDG